MQPQIKFGIPHPDVSVPEMLPYRYPNIWAREQFPSFERLTIAPASDHIDLIRALLAELLPPPPAGRLAVTSPDHGSVPSTVTPPITRSE